MQSSNPNDKINIDFVTQFLQIAEIEFAKLKVQESSQQQSNNIQPETVSFSKEQTQQQNILKLSNDVQQVKQEDIEDQQKVANLNNKTSEVKKKRIKVSQNTQEKTKKVSNILKKKITKIEKPQITNDANQPEKQTRRSYRNVKKSQQNNPRQKQQKKKTNKLSESQLQQFQMMYETNTNSFLMKKFKISRHQLFRYKDKYNLVKNLTFIQKMIQNRDKSQNISSKKVTQPEQPDETAEDIEIKDSEDIINEEDDGDNENNYEDDDDDDDDDIDIQIQPEIEDDAQEKNLNQDQVIKSTLLQSKNHFNPSNEELDNQNKIISEESNSTQTQINQNQLNSLKQARYKYI
ncbi:hypothetical protein TTHERM_00140870 (macronuclear) [Tetrahymena thermophila SB210]|uniref:Uncharacterized protein n=1 Tax=Tetrahymena thermophila (strain SB210) TaxID=312017 RepID=I7MI17_TETTS|nr:hypothetical protein TTHERM_00140870 [Tetrahymena thermophila SB210]EAR90779.1 hypothetical protein TTHERM_00140870 [Tetrahymena thermophila SB210]|eukprot:XP_001011024.1 hypothetical protein TTHERM_00140870 [Tetrahymena thermophila SB210]